jgi:hypothetical protein
VSEYSYDRAPIPETTVYSYDRTASRGKPLYGHTDMNSAYLVDDYPYGARLRCRIRYWLESNPSKGFRFVSQTEDPRTLRWNKPKASTFTRIAGCMLFLDAKNHVQWTGLSEYSKPSDCLEFVKDFPGADMRILKVWVKKKIEFYGAYAEGKVRTTINGIEQPMKEEDIGRAKKELEDWEEVGKRL